MEIVEDRYGAGSTLVTSQLPVDTWHEVIDEPTFADAILDRLVHNAYRLALDGPSMRKIRAEEEAAASAEATTTTPTKPGREPRNERRTPHPARPRGSTGPSRARRCVSLVAALRAARGSLPLMTGTAYRREEDEHHA